MRKFVVVHDFITNDLGLKGNDALVYAVIFGFARVGKKFNGSAEYIAKLINGTRQGVGNNLKKLLDMKLITKRHDETTFNRNIYEIADLDKVMILLGVDMKNSQNGMAELKEDTKDDETKKFIVLYEFITNELGLKGNDALVYALIFGFSRNGYYFTGSTGYIAKLINSTTQGVGKNLRNLLKKNLIQRTIDEFNRYVYWVVNYERMQNLVYQEEEIEEVVEKPAEINMNPFQNIKNTEPLNEETIEIEENSGPTEEERKLQMSYLKELEELFG